MAPPELPDDRRAQHLRYGSVDPSTASRPLGDPAPPLGHPARPVGPPDDVSTEALPSVAAIETERASSTPASGVTDRAPDHADVRPPRHHGAPGERPATTYRPPTSARTGRPQKRRRSSFWRELPILVVVALVLTFLIQTFLAKVYVIPSGSMESTLHGCTGCANDRVLVDKVTYLFREPQPGDVIVFRGPDSWRNTEFTVEETANPVQRVLQGLGSLVGLAPPNEKDFVKRVIATGGQTVACCDTQNRVTVDGQPLQEPYISYIAEAGPPRQAPFGPITVPDDELWMMGDSRNNSADSRVPGHGPIPVDNVIGQARLIVMPVDRLGTIPSIDPQSRAVGMAAPEDGPVGGPVALGLLAVALPGLIRRRTDGGLVDEPFLPPAAQPRRGT